MQFLASRSCLSVGSGRVNKQINGLIQTVIGKESNQRTVIKTEGGGRSA